MANPGRLGKVSGKFQKPLILGQEVDNITGAGAVSTTKQISSIVSGGAIALTLADGVEGQIKHIVMKTDGGDATLTPANLAGGTTITFDNNDTATLIFLGGTWYMVGGIAALA